MMCIQSVHYLCVYNKIKGALFLTNTQKGNAKEPQCHSSSSGHNTSYYSIPECYHKIGTSIIQYQNLMLITSAVPSVVAIHMTTVCM